MSMNGINPGEEPQILCVDDQAITLWCIMATFKTLGETCIGKMSGADAL